MPQHIAGFHGAADLGDVIRTMSRLLTDPGQCRPVAVIFGRPTCPIMKEEILPDFEYYHFRSGESIECFCIGYVRSNQGFYEATDDPLDGRFSAMTFADAVKELEGETKWKYGGETELILLNAYRPPKGNAALLDFSTVISFSLEDAKRIKAIESARQFFEILFNFAISYEGKTFTYDFSDHLGLRVAASGLKSFFFRFIPKPFGRSMTQALKFYIKDFSRAEVAAAALKYFGEPDERIIEDFGDSLGARIIEERRRLQS